MLMQPADASLAAQKHELWLYYSTNLQVDENVNKLEAVWRKAASAGYTHVMLTDSKFARLGELGSMEKKYFANIQRVKRIAAELKLQIVPALFSIGYSNNMLWHNPNLAEGLPVRDSLFVVKNGQAELVPDPPVNFGKPDWKDDSVAINGNIATVENAGSNARFVYKLNLPEFRCYHISVWIKTDNFRGTPEVKVLAGERSLQFQNLGVKQTQEWTRHDTVFNTLDCDKVNIYFGVWGGGRGKLQWKDWKTEEAGLVNVLRRKGTPLVVRNADGRVLSEGRDFDKIQDSKLGNEPWNGEYTSWHEAPIIRTRLPAGTKLRVSWFHPAIIYDGAVMCCLSEPETDELLRDEAKRMKAAWGAKGYAMAHDEIRTMNWDHACTNRHLDAGRILAENVTMCRKLLGDSDAYVWSDMFDPDHNAHAGYYLVRGNLSESWTGLDKSVTILNWNFDKRDKSLKFFADRGHKQIIAGYYDSAPEKIREWLASAAKVNGVTGVMYTTWENNYNDIETFARICRESPSW